MDAAGYRMSASPAYFNGTLYTGPGVSDRHIPGGLVAAIDGTTGAIKWVFNTIPQKPTDDGWDIAKDTWIGGQRAGGGIWTQPAIDAELGLLYLNAGNPSPVYEGTPASRSDVRPSISVTEAPSKARSRSRPS
jgi:glucose dehydrogenase